MTTEPAGRTIRHDGGDFSPSERPSIRTSDDDGRDDERADENEAPVGAVDEQTEAPEEFSVDDEGSRDARGARDAVDDDGDHASRR